MIPLLTIALLGAACTGLPPGSGPSGDPAGASGEPIEPPATLDPLAELERVMELRQGWGLRADADWVRRVEQDPAAVVSPLGIRVMPEEAAELQQMLDDDPVTALIMYGARNHAEFGGLWVNEPGVGTVMLFTRDLERHRQAIAAIAPNQRFDVRPCRYTEAQLRTLQWQLIDEVQRLPGVQLLSLGLDVKSNVVELQAKSNDPALGQRLEQQHAGMLRAVIHPLPGPWSNVAAGDGWHLLAAGRSPTEGYRVRVAQDADEWRQMWAALDPINAAPEVDFATEIAASFGHGIGSSCPELRLDEVVIDHRASLVYSRTSDPLAPRSCTADLAGGAYFVVALQRAALPGSPFTLRLRGDEIGGEQASLRIELRP